MNKKYLWIVFTGLLSGFLSALFNPPHMKTVACTVGERYYPVGSGFCGHSPDEPQQRTLNGDRYTCSASGSLQKTTCPGRDICVAGVCTPITRTCQIDDDCSHGARTTWCEKDEAGQWVEGSATDAPLLRGVCGHDHTCTAEKGTAYCVDPVRDADACRCRP